MHSNLFVLFISLFCDSCNNDDKIEVKKKNEENTYFIILSGSAVCLHLREQWLKIFTITEIGLHRRVFIITLDMTKLQKYPCTLNISYRRGESPTCYLSIPSCLNMTYMPEHSLRVTTQTKVLHQPWFFGFLLKAK